MRTGCAVGVVRLEEFAAFVFEGADAAFLDESFFFGEVPLAGELLLEHERVNARNGRDADDDAFAKSSRSERKASIRLPTMRYTSSGSVSAKR